MVEECRYRERGAGQMRKRNRRAEARVELMTGSTGNIEAVARAACAKSLGHDGKSKQQLATDVEMYWHVVAAYLEAGAVDETGRETRDLNWDEKQDLIDDWVRRHPESAAAWRKARFGSPQPRT